VIDKLLADPSGLELGGTKQNLTILFSDIRGFTALSEALGAEPLVAFLNEYLTHMTDLVLDTEGVLDKYIGDAVMAFWGAPIKQEDHALRACKTALAMKRKLDLLRPVWTKQGKPEIAIGIGVNTDDVIVGNMGSKRRFDYTVIGDGVNLASRLEGLTKQYGATIIISESTKRALPANYLVRELDLVTVKGKTQPVAIYELLSDSVDDKARDLAQRFGVALALYRQRKWDEAKAAFASISVDFRDKASTIFVGRCDEMKAHDPGDGWNGAYVASEK